MPQFSAVLLRFFLTVLMAFAMASEAAAREFTAGRLFRIDRPGAPSSFVFGTMHSNDPRVTAVPGAVLAALARCKTAAFESLIGEGDAAAFVAAAHDESGRGLGDAVDATTLARIRAALGGEAPDLATLAKAKPWALLLMLAQPRQSGPPALDALLKVEAQSRKLALIGLELPEEQTASLDAIPRLSQLALLRWALDSESSRAAELEATTRAWLKGDLAALRRLALAPSASNANLRPHFESLFKHLIVDRNALMAHRLHVPLMRGGVFVAVGAMHLEGDQGLLALIKQQGYRIVRIL